MKKSLLLVDDEIDMLFILGEAFENDGFTIYRATNANDGIKLFNEHHPGIVVTDIMMPKVNGLQMVQKIRESDLTTPIFFLTSLISVQNAIEGFNSGANDYIRKPFSVSEVVARANAALNRAAARKTEHFQLGSYTFSPSQMTLVNGNTVIKLTGRQVRLLHILAQNLNSIVNTDDLIKTSAIEKKDYFALRCLQVHIVKLRQILACEPALSIITERGIGYRLVDSSTGRAENPQQEN